ncbi:M61 family metallopeptidase [Limnovirga soli]|uniref:M61 family peptidase n=1 Tax=Limnovirga soli TaxID=2656915 RepID=A0A8J8FDD3_9BACT|nr:M61 family metallopeptidase [Limnovirga soli]NNV54299.1 M61 family peptidase [Limnovirga soli]
MKKSLCKALLIVLVTVFCWHFGAIAQQSNMHFLVSMPQPTTHYFHVEFKVNNLKQSNTLFKLPSWTPGYYWLENYAKNLVNFKAFDANGKSLAWKKTSKNSWNVTGNTTAGIVVSYDMYAFNHSVADPYLDEAHAYIPPAGLLMYIDKQLQQNAIVEIQPANGWKSISTGLEPVKNKANTFYANNFDELYDCPILAGNHTVWSFTVKGITHEVALMQPEKFSKESFLKDLTAMVSAASDVVHDIPYKHYTFLIMGDGRGGLEHRNSTAVFSSGTVYNPNDTEGYKRWMSFLAHEYFHLYNIKCIRPIALGPFDYDKENYTNMLWVSEGITVYYEYLVLNRCGLLNMSDCLDQITRNLEAYENVPGHLIQSATQASFDTWIQFFARGDNANNTQISYYDKGCVLGFMLDAAIRHSSGNKRSLDDVMTTLYQKYYQQLKRGFTDDEFKQVCEATAGSSLNEVFEYAATVKQPDYKKYFAYAGLSLSIEPKYPENLYTGITLQEKENKLYVTGVAANSPAWRLGVSTNDTIVTADGIHVNGLEFSNILKNKHRGDSISLVLENGYGKKQINIIAENRTEKKFIIKKNSQLNVLDDSIRKSIFPTE